MLPNVALTLLAFHSSYGFSQELMIDSISH